MHPAVQVALVRLSQCGIMYAKYNSVSSGQSGSVSRKSAPWFGEAGFMGFL